MGSSISGIAPRVALILLCVLSVLYATQSLAYSTRVPVNVSNTTGGTLNNHTIRIELNAANVPGFNWANNGNDILVTDPAFTPIDYYLESFDSVAQQAVLWIEVPTVPPSLPDTTVFIYYDDATATSLSSAANTFANSGFKYHTQFYNDATPGPESRAEGIAMFDFDTVAATGSGYGCTNLNSIEVDNSGTFGSNNDIAYFFETFFEVPADATYEFRMGMDFGHGGELYVDDITVEADWTDDLWWGLNYNNADTLTGSISLTSGVHTLKALGYERCCDGPSGIQFRTSPTAPWVDFEVGSPGATLYAPDCPITTATIGPPETVPVTLSQFKSRKIGPFVRFDWQTVSETFNVGFNVWAQVDGQWQQLNRRLIRSHSTDSAIPEAYRFEFNNARQQLHFEQVALSSIDVSGRQEFHGPFRLDQEYGAEQIPEPIDWSAIQQEFAQRMQARGYQYINHRWRKPRAIKPGNDAASSAAQVAMSIAEAGIHRVTHADLLKLGVDWSGVLKRDIAIRHQAQGIPRFIGGRSNRFGPNSYIDFFANTPQGRDRLYLKESTYQLLLDPQSVRGVGHVKRRATELADWHYASVRIEQQNEYYELSQSDDPWLMDVVFADRTPVDKVYSFTVAGDLQTAEMAKVTLQVIGYTDLPSRDIDGDGELDDEHHVKLFLNDKPEAILDERFDGFAVQNMQVDIPADWLREGENNLRVQVVADTGYAFDMIGIDAMTIDYPVSSTTQALGSIHFSIDSEKHDGLTFSGSRRKNMVAYAYDNEHNLARLKMSRVNRKQFSVPKTAAGEASYWISTLEQILVPSDLFVLPTMPELDLTSSQLLIVSHPSFIGDTLRDYAAQRAAAGVSNQIISTDDIAQIYGVDVPLTTAIRRFLQAADQRIEYDSVLLVGGHSFDYLNHLSAEKPDQAVVNFLPAFYQSVWLVNYNPTDVPFVDFDDDGLPEKAIGRWPVRTQADLVAITRKSIAWADNLAQRQQAGLDVVLIADEQDGLDFVPDLDQIGAQLLNTSLSGTANRIDKIYVDALKADPAVPSNQVFQTARQQLIDAVNNGSDVLIYNGHSSPSVWSFQSLLTTQSIAQMQNQGQPALVMPLACYTTYYESTSTNTLAHQLLLSGEHGAAVVHGAMMLGQYAGNLKMAQEVLRFTKEGMQGGAHSSAEQLIPLSVGQAVMQAKRNLPINYINTAYNWALLGDPSLPAQ